LAGMALIVLGISIINRATQVAHPPSIPKV
jgi:hypothetical protein